MSPGGGAVATRQGGQRKLDRRPGPVVIEAVVDPLTPPMPAKATPDQAIKLAKALAKGEKDRGKIIKTIFKDKVRELV